MGTITEGGLWVFWRPPSHWAGRLDRQSAGQFFSFGAGERCFLPIAFLEIATCGIYVLIFRGKEERRKVSVDYLGVLSLVIGFPSFLIALTAGTRLGLGCLGRSFSGLPWRHGNRQFRMARVACRSATDEPPLFQEHSLCKVHAVAVLATLAFYPVSIFGPIYLLNVIGTAPLSAGLAMATLPLCTTLVSPLSGRLADRFNPRWVAVLVCASFFWVCFFYADSVRNRALIWIVFVLSILGAGIGLFVPANDKAAFSTVPSREYGMLAAMLTAFGTGSGALGTTSR